jgi:hypothetical protein
LVIVEKCWVRREGRGKCRREAQHDFSFACLGPRSFGYRWLTDGEVEQLKTLNSSQLHVGYESNHPDRVKV